MLDNFRRIDIRWEKATDSIYKSVNVMSSDELGRKLVVQVLDGGLPAKTDRLELELYWEAQNKKNYGLDYFELIDEENTIFEMYFTTGLLSNIGRLKSNLVLRDSKGIVTSNTFYIEVFEGVDSNAVESSNSFSKLTKIVNEIEYMTIEEEERVQAEAERIRNEDLRAESEVGRRASEEIRKATEKEREMSESKRTDNESLRKQNEANRVATESQRESSESDRKESELNRIISEKTRSTNEDSRKSSETLRQSAEENRELQESFREEKETIRSSSEDTRERSESERIDAENIRSESEKDRESQEELRKTNEIERVDSENGRNAEEMKRVNSEKSRTTEEEKRVLRENQRVSSENNRNSAEEERELAEGTRKTNEDVRIENMEIVKGWVDNPEQFDGRSIEYNWRGTELGVRLEGEAEYTYIELKGETGSVDNLTPEHIQGALGFLPKDYKAGSNIAITGNEISVTGQLGLTAEEVKQVKVDKATDADTVAGYTVAKDIPVDAKLTDTIVDISGKAEKIDLEAVESYLDELRRGSIVSEQGFKDLRVFENGIQYWDGSNWIEIEIGGGASIKVGNVSYLSAEAKLGNEIDILWKDPEDVVFEGATLAQWAGTQLRRKEGTYPQDENDGVLVVDSKVRNQYSGGYTDSGLTHGVEYFYSLFPYTEGGSYTVDTANRVQAKAFLKYDREAPNKPTVKDIVLLEATVTSDSGSVVSLDQNNWYRSPHTFTNLTEEETYTPYSKFEEASEYFESEVVVGNSFTAIAKDTQPAPSAPTISNLDFDRVTIASVAGAEVRLGSGTWYDGPHTFTGLTEKTDYQAYARMKETSTKLPSPSSPSETFTTPVEQQIYGFEIDESNTNPKTAVTYIGDAIGMTPAKGNNGNFNWGSWEPFVKEISKPVVVKNGVEQYDLNYDNYNQKYSGGSSTLTGSEGDVFTRFKHIHMKYTKLDNGHRWELSDKPFPGSFSMTKDMENGYNQFNNPMLVTLQNLFILIFKDRDSQTALGRGRVDGAGYISSGNTNNKGFMYGSTSDEQIKFLGIEDFWGNKFQWIDGLVSDSSYNLLVGDKNFNDSGSGYSKQTTNISSNTGGYFRTVQGGKGGYVLADSSGSSSTGYADYGDLNSGRVARFGGTQSNSDSSGAFRLRLNYTTSYSGSYISARLCYKNNDAFYVGAYLGYEQSGKLRSVSDNMPADSKTIGSFRTLAQANN